jgi:transcriptional regulator with XRE-family HTH domain
LAPENHLTASYKVIDLLSIYYRIIDKRYTHVDNMCTQPSRFARALSPMTNCYAELGIYIREQRLRPGRRMTQHELAKRVDKSSSEISRWEKGERRPKQPSLLKLANIFGVPVQILQQKAGHTPEFDWYSSLAEAKRPDGDILLSATDEERDELRAHLRYLRFRSSVLEMGKPHPVNP